MCSWPMVSKLPHQIDSPSECHQEKGPMFSHKEHLRALCQFPGILHVTNQSLRANDKHCYLYSFHCIQGRVVLGTYYMICRANSATSLPQYFGELPLILHCWLTSIFSIVEVPITGRKDSQIPSTRIKLTFLETLKASADARKPQWQTSLFHYRSLAHRWFIYKHWRAVITEQNIHGH